MNMNYDLWVYNKPDLGQKSESVEEGQNYSTTKLQYNSVSHFQTLQ